MCDRHRDDVYVCVHECVSVTRGGAAHKHNSWQLTKRAKHLQEQHTGQSHSGGGAALRHRRERGRSRGTTTQGGAKSHARIHTTHVPIRFVTAG